MSDYARARVIRHFSSAERVYDAGEATLKEVEELSPEAVKALLDVDALKQSKNRDADIQSALESVKADNGYLFEDGKQPPAVTVPGNPAPTGTDDAAYMDAFYKNNPFYQKQ